MQKKNKKILIILIILCIILILGITFSILYFATDLFKSNQELFLKYASKAFENSEDSFIGTDINEYFNKKEQTPYQNQGTITPNISTQNGQEQFENVNNFDISYTGGIDNLNSRLKEDISLNYSNDSKMEFSYQKVGEQIGLQTDYVNSKYVVSTAEEIPNLDADLGNVIEVLSKIQELKNIDLSWEEIARIRDTYFNVLSSNLTEDNFVKVSSSDVTGYQLNITGDELKNITLKLLETLQNDTETLDKINEYLKVQSSSNSITVNDIAKLIEDINNNQDILNKTVKITVYVNGENLNRLEININENILDITKNKVDTNVGYNISFKGTGDNPVNILLNLNFTNITSNEGITEDYELQIGNNDITYNYKLNNNINFQSVSNIEDFSDDNAMILSNYDSAEVTSFISQVRQRIIDVNKELMERIGLLENENPLFMSLPDLSKFFNINIAGTKLSEEEINAFNQKFELYQSTKLAGVTVKGLLTTIDQNNEQQENGETGNSQLMITEINFNGEEYDVNEQTVTMLKEEVKTDVDYRVEFEKDSNTGLIYRAVINEKVA